VLTSHLRFNPLSYDGGYRKKLVAADVSRRINPTYGSTCHRRIIPPPHGGGYYTNSFVATLVRARIAEFGPGSWVGMINLWWECGVGCGRKASAWWDGEGRSNAEA